MKPNSSDVVSSFTLLQSIGNSQANEAHVISGFSTLGNDLVGSFSNLNNNVVSGFRNLNINFVSTNTALHLDLIKSTSGLHTPIHTQLTSNSNQPNFLSGFATVNNEIAQLNLSLNNTSTQSNNLFNSESKPMRLKKWTQ